MSIINLYLSSQSPRRAELLTQIGISFGILSGAVSEDRLADEDPITYVRRLALAKAKAGFASPEKIINVPVLGADTIVALHQTVFGKPQNLLEAKTMLSQLSGRIHSVFTAIAMVSEYDEAVVLSETKVKFKDLSSVEIDAYCQTEEPWDKAGGYAAQGVGALFIEHIEGSFSGVVGLPLYETGCLIKRFGIKLLE